MLLAEVKERLEYVLNCYKERFDGSGLLTDAKITYQNDECDDCDAEDAKMSYICGEFSVRTSEMEADDGLWYCMIIDCGNKNKIDEKKFDTEATEFCESMDKLIKGFEEAVDPREYLAQEIKAANEESQKLIDEMHATVSKVEKLLKAAIIATCAALAVGLLLAILL